MKFDAMFQPIQIGPVTVKNRFVVPPMGNNFANTDGTMSEQSVAYYRERAKGGFGLITIEATVVHKGAKGGPRKPCLYDDSTIESFKKVVDACHAEGAKVSVQLQNAGPEGNAKNAGAPITAATSIPAACGRDIPRELSTEEVYELVKGYGEAARRDSYVAVGARSVEDQQHRLTVSGMDVPAGMKNPTSGDFSVMLNSVVAAQGSHTFIYRGWEVETTGNELTHTILRGAVNKHGEAIPNYHYEDLRLLFEKYSAKNLKNMATIVDTNHSNSNKQYEQQIRIAKEVLHSRQVDSDVRGLVKGLMIESYIEPGNQKIGPNHVYGKSITDACLGWEESEKLLYTIAEMC